MDVIRKPLLALLINVSAVALTTALLPGFLYSGGLQNLLSIALVIGGVNMLLRPIASLFSVPIGLIGYSVLMMIANTAMFLLANAFVAGFAVITFPFPGYTNGSIVLAPMTLPAWGTAFIASLCILAINLFLFWLTKHGGHKAKKHH